MKIERVTFLALTAAIAAACSSTKEPVAPIIAPEPARPDASDSARRPKTIAEIVEDGGGTPVVMTDVDASTRPGFPPACALDEMGSPAQVCGTWKVDPTCEAGGDDVESCKRFWGDRQKT